MEKGIIKIGDKVKFKESFILKKKEAKLITLENEKWWHEIHIVTRVGYEDDRCRPIKDLKNHNGLFYDEYVIFDNDENTYSNTSDNMIII